MAMTTVAWAVAMAVWAAAVAIAMAGMVMAAVTHLAVADTGPMDFTEKLLETLQDNSSLFPDSTF